MMLRQRRECKKIPKRAHSLSEAVLLSLLLGPIGSLVSAELWAQRPSQRALQASERRALLAEIKPRVVTLSREAELKSGLRALVPQRQLGRGLWLSPELILSAEGWLEPSPIEAELKVSARQPEGRALRLQPLHRSPQTGLAILIPQHIKLNASGERPRRELLRAALSKLEALAHQSARPRQLSAPLTLWALSEGASGRAVVPVMITGRGLSYEAYYWKLSAPMLWGDPLFDEQGRWLSLSCAQGRLLPLNALSELIAELRLIYAQSSP